MSGRGAEFRLRHGLVKLLERRAAAIVPNHTPIATPTR